MPLSDSLSFQNLCEKVQGLEIHLDLATAYFCCARAGFTGLWEMIVKYSQISKSVDKLLVAWIWPWWEYLHHRNWQKLQTKALFFFFEKKFTNTPLLHSTHHLNTHHPSYFHPCWITFCSLISHAISLPRTLFSFFSFPGSNPMNVSSFNFCMTFFLTFIAF